MMSLSSTDFDAKLAAKLDRLEAGTALLERDARKRRALLDELGFVAPASRARLMWRAVSRSRRMLLAAIVGGAALAQLARLVRAAVGPHLATAARATASSTHEIAVICAATALAMAPFVLAILIFATPE